MMFYSWYNLFEIYTLLMHSLFFCRGLVYHLNIFHYHMYSQFCCCWRWKGIAMCCWFKRSSSWTRSTTVVQMLPGVRWPCTGSRSHSGMNQEKEAELPAVSTLPSARQFCRQKTCLVWKECWLAIAKLSSIVSPCNNWNLLFSSLKNRT